MILALKLFFLLSIAVFVVIDIDLFEEGKKGRFGLAVSFTIYLVLMLAKLVFV